ncbi:hypothetical protein GCG54_00007977 [Colletotrichum gloeosporioides]|uniref:Uncharacterized protein n=1 Tax=Colletotrichum gloeosporioides TaxID=474922 RepID=A0A8H4C6A7_COLGL|nr:uncharacterized protein GCG54_00007977 [Colletotrichum gloeosporioides]KAF3797924.1 hypothetical protein GCG54_00007977 [Colletotrichum gloeosporioides]
MSLSLSGLAQALPTTSSTSSTKPRPRPTNTASPADSIWKHLPEADFRQHVVELEKLTNAVPVHAQTFPLPPQSDLAADHANSDGDAAADADAETETGAAGADVVGRNPDCVSQQPHPRQLSLAAEQRLADDIAYLIAVGEGAQSVAATTVQESRRPQGKGLRVTIASVDAIEPDSQAFLRAIFQRLSTVSAEPSAKTLHSLVDQVTRHHQARLLNRLRSCKWKKPTYLSRTHKKALHADFANLLHRAQFLYTKKEVNERAQLEKELLALAALLEAFETTPPDDDHEALVDIVRSSYQVCTSSLVADYLQRLQGVRATTQIQACLKTLRQIEKIAAYYRICLSLTRLSQAHAKLFHDVDLLFLLPYEAVPITTVAFQPWAKSTHVHAEVILSVHHDLELHRPQPGGPPWHRPRCLGASKYFCYLCFLFIRHHGAYFAANTHGACYDQWTVPDLADYPETMADRYREVLRAMDTEIQNQTQGAVWRPEPMTSRENLIGIIQQ